MTSTQMKIDDFLTVMSENAETYPEFAALPDEQKRLIANGNIVTGTAETFREDGEIVGVGGIRYIGIGEAWCLTSPENRTPSMLRVVARNFARIREEQSLWRIFASSKISENFLKHLAFRKDETIYTYTIDGRRNVRER